MMKTCITCKQEKPLDRFAASRGCYRGECKDCTNRRAANNRPLSDIMKAVLVSIRHNGLTNAALQERFPDITHIPRTMDVLLKKGLVEKDGAYWSLTPAGRAACPCRNPHYASRFQGHEVERPRGSALEL
jgi:hypothetical protein